VVKKLCAKNLQTRRAFLKKAARKVGAPVIVIYSVHKNATPLFGRTPV
jgi:hypothetical protein